MAFADGLLDGRARDEVAAHLDSCEDCATLVAVAGRRTAPASPGDAPLPRGFSLDRYIVIDRLGEGGLGVVYTAYDPQLDRRIAVKVLKHTADARFAAEAKALARVAHPNVVAVYDAGIASGHAFIAMELVEGVTLRRWLGASPRTWQEIRDVFVAAGRGLQAVHDAGLMHRDFKPGNVLVGTDGRVRVLDFGLARLTDARREPPAVERDLERVDGATPSGYILGTPAYISPEQVDGGAIDSQTDQFSFGVALYEALFGVRPFPSDDLRARGDAVRSRALATPQSDLEVPSRLREAVVRGLCAAPSDRYPSMAEFIAALAFEVPARRRGRSVLLALALVGVGSIGTAVYLRGQPDDAELAAVRDLQAQARDAASRSFFVYPPAEAPDTPTAYSSVAALEALDGEHGVDTAVGLRTEFAGTLVRLGDRYWDVDGGRPFAADYYVAALVFDPTHPHALERAVVTPAQIARMQGVAADLTFTDAELAAARGLIALAEDDPAARRDQVAALLDAEPRVPSTTAEHLASVVGLNRRPPSKEPAEPVAAPVVAQHEPAAAAPAKAPGAAARRKPRGPRAAAEDDTLPAEAATDAASARTLAQQGSKALRAGKLGDAERLFHQALEANRRSLAALDGLREIYFERGAYRRAIGFAKRSVGVAPKDAKFRLRLGDLYYRVLQYADARTQYRKALDLGSARAEARLKRLDDRTGG